MTSYRDFRTGRPKKEIVKVCKRHDCRKPVVEGKHFCCKEHSPFGHYFKRPYGRKKKRINVDRSKRKAVK